MNKKLSRIKKEWWKENKKLYSGKNAHFYGKHHNKETCQKISDGHKGKLLNHKLNCQCCICKAKRGETKGKKNYNFGNYWNNKQKKSASLKHGGTGISGELSEYGIEFDSALKEQIRFRDK